MKAIEPREVAPGAARRWLGEALALGSRRPLDLLLYLGAGALLLNGPSWSGRTWLLIGVHPLLLLSAQAADTCASRRETLRAHRRALMGWGAQIAMLSVLILAVSLAMDWSGARVAAMAGKTGPPPGWLVPAVLPLCAFGMLLMAWEVRNELFSLPLRICAEVEKETVRKVLGRWGVHLNPVARRLAVGFCFGLLAALLLHPVALALTQYLLAFIQYVAYRDVYLGQAENEPVPARVAAVPAPAPSA